MTIDEIIKKAKDEGDGFKFKAKEGQSIRPDVTFEVLDAWFGFITYSSCEGFITVNQLKEMIPFEIDFELVK